MDALKNWMHPKKHNSWRKLRNTWFDVAFSEKTLPHNSQKYNNWNPWKDWCEAWEKFLSSGEKPPKSEKPKAAVFFEMFDLAKLTSDKLEEAKTMRMDLSQKIQENESLRNHKLILINRCAELQMELNTREKMRVQNLEKEAYVRKVLENQVEFLTEQVKVMEDKLRPAQAKCGQLEEAISSFQNQLLEAKTMRKDLKQKIRENESLRNQKLILKNRCAEHEMELNTSEMMRVQNQEKEAYLRKALENQGEFLTEQVQLMEEKLWQAQAKCDQLEEVNSSFQNKLVEYKKNNNYQVNIKNDFHIHQKDQSFPHKQLENGEGEKSLDLESIKSIVERLGQVTRLNVFEWLCSCDAEYRIWQWSEKDFEKILHRCMNSGIFSSIIPRIRMSEIPWHEKCKYIAERFVPDLDDVFYTEKMRTDEQVLQYFSRMWTIYNFTKVFTSRDDPEYLDAICNGLLPHLYEAIRQVCDEDYETIEAAVLSAEHFWRDSEKQEYYRSRDLWRAGAGCPSRVNIWRRLKENGVPHKDIDGAIYWDLVVRLSRCEDLGTRARRI